MADLKWCRLCDEVHDITGWKIASGGTYNRPTIVIDPLGRAHAVINRTTLKREPRRPIAEASKAERFQPRIAAKGATNDNA